MIFNHEILVQARTRAGRWDHGKESSGRAGLGVYRKRRGAGRTNGAHGIYDFKKRNATPTAKIANFPKRKHGY
jgi:hypothetical protein